MIQTLDRQAREAALRERMAEHILVLDGGMGTLIQSRHLTAEDFGGAALEGCNEVLVRQRPDVILDIHRAYLEAGADVVETDTFGGTPLVLGEYGLAAEAESLNEVGARLAREACRAFDSKERLHFVAGSMGPTTRALSVTGGITFEELKQHFRIQARGLIKGGADYLLVETCQDTRNIKAALLGIELSFGDLGVQVPVAVSGTVEASGTLLAGQAVDALYASLAHWPLLYLGLNCATGPEFMTDHIRTLSGLSQFPLGCLPNAGLPDETGKYLETPEIIARIMARFMDAGWLNVIGGCCGTTPAHIRALAREAATRRPARPLSASRCLVSGIEALELTDDNRPAMVGERTNVLGSKKFKQLIVAGDYESASEIARKQVKGGAAIIDVGLADPDRDEAVDMDRFLEVLIKKVKAPLMIDSTDPKVIERALTWCQGKAVINSINLEDGEDRFEAVVPLARRYGAALVVGCIDEDPSQGMAVTRERKLAIARRSRDLLLHKYGVREEDLIFDPLVFPCATGSEAYIGSAVETIEGIRLIKQEIPGARTILGISNVSFGLPPAGREILNSVFLYHCTLAGLDAAIVNAERLERYASIPELERKLAEDLLFNRGEDPVAAFAAHFKGRTKVSAQHEELPLDKRLARYIIEGSKEGLVADLELKLKEASPLDVINGPLMDGMAEVGRLFNNNELIVAEVLQSAEAMKAAVSYLEPMMERADGAQRGTMLLATVKGDVHDIGKNLVDIILSNNGFRVINLGIKIAPETLIAEARKHRPDFIGLSGLLVKSAQQMEVTASDLNLAGIDCPILVGGAALSRKFTESRIAKAYGGLVVYCKDAMHGLEVANKVTTPAGRAELKADLQSRADWWNDVPESLSSVSPEPLPRRSDVRLDVMRPLPPDLERHALRNLPRAEIWEYLNLQMVYGKHLGLRGSVHALRKERDPKFLELESVVEEVKAACQEGLMEVSAVYQFFRACPDGDRLLVLSPEKKVLEAFEFPRQGRKPHLCLADYCLPEQEGQTDHVAFFVTTAGKRVREQAEAWKLEGQYLKCHALQALALETAEAAAEWLHRRLRNAWGISDPLELTIEQIHRAQYAGKRYSFGYPACPNLADQEGLWRLLRPDDIGVSLTGGHMMEPEASVSALVFHHPDARYFAVS